MMICKIIGNYTTEVTGENEKEKVMKKKVLAAFLAGTMVCGLLAGCGNSADNNSAKEDSSDDVYNVIMQLPVTGDAPSGLEDVEAAINEITEEKIGVTVTLEPVNAFNLANETSLAVSSGEKLDLSLSLYSGVGSLVSSGTIMELDDLLDEYGQDILDICGDQMSGGTYDGQQYAVPIAYLEGEDMAFIARKDILDKYNIKIDENKYYTIDEIEDIFATVKAGEGDSFYIMAGGYSNTDLPLGALYSMDDLGGGCGLVFANDESSDEIVNYYASDMYKEYAERMYDWAQKGYYSPDASTTTEVSNTQIASGKYLGCFLNDSVVTAKDVAAQTGTEMVSIKSNQAIKRSSNYQSTLWSIPTTCENPEKTMEFLNLLYSDAELDNLLMYGIEGTSYEIVDQDENGTVIQPVDGKAATDVPDWSTFGVFGNRLSWYVTAPNTTSTNKELKEFSDKVTKESPALGFVCNFDNVSTEYSAVNSVIAQYRGILNTGSIDPVVELPEFLNALDAAGIDKVLEEVQSQYTEWKAEK